MCNSYLNTCIFAGPSDADKFEWVTQTSTLIPSKIVIAGRAVSTQATAKQSSRSTDLLSHITSFQPLTCKSFTMDTSGPLDVLISGSGIAGPCVAFWLHKFLPSSRITILERSPTPRLGGQAIDLRSAAVPIVDRMGLLGKVKDKTTTEQGMEFIYADGKTKATFPVSGNVEQQSSKSTQVNHNSF